MNKLILEYPTLDIVKKQLSKDFPEVIEILFKNQMDNIREFDIIDYLVNVAGYYIEKLRVADNARTTFIVHFKKRKS